MRPTTPYHAEMPEGLSASWKALSQCTSQRLWVDSSPLCFRPSLKGRLESRDLKVTSRDTAEGQYEHRAVGIPRPHSLSHLIPRDLIAQDRKLWEQLRLLT